MLRRTYYLDTSLQLRNQSGTCSSDSTEVIFSLQDMHQFPFPQRLGTCDMDAVLITEVHPTRNCSNISPEQRNT